MTRITVLGGTGYAGSAIVREAAARGHSVVSFSRSLPGEPVPGVHYETGSLLEDAVQQQAVEGSEVVFSALSPRGELDGHLVEVDLAVAERAGTLGVRFGVIGGFSSMRLRAGEPPIGEGDIPPAFASEGKQMHAILIALRQTTDVDWFFVSAGQRFGSGAPGEALGRYRIGGDVALPESVRASPISSADFALAILDEIENPHHHRAHFSVSY